LYFAWVNIYNATGEFFASGYTGSGSAIIDLPAGTYSATSHPGGYNQNDYLPFEVKPGYFAPLTVPLTPANPTVSPSGGFAATTPPVPPGGQGLIRFSLSDALLSETLASRLVFPSRVALYDQVGQLVTSKDTTKGVAVFTLAAGTYYAIGSADTLGYRDAKTQYFAIKAGSDQSQKIPLYPTTKYIVTNAVTGRPLYQATAAVYDINGPNIDFKSTAADGSAVFYLRAGTYQSWASLGGYEPSQYTTFVVDPHSLVPLVEDIALTPASATVTPPA
jgi:hypothetical protein